MKIIIGCALLGAALGILFSLIEWKDTKELLCAVGVTFVVITLFAAGTYLIGSGL